MIKSIRKLTKSTNYLSKRTKTKQELDVLFDICNNAGIITLNRPQHLNCITTSMILKIIPKIKEWERTKSLIIVKGAGEKAFCAGGDAKLNMDKVKGAQLEKLFWHEFNFIYVINNCPIPFLTINNGYTVGGGLGISICGKYRIATERTLMSMPETKIGLSPGVGATYILPRLQSKTGYYLGLTGNCKPC